MYQYYILFPPSTAEKVEVTNHKPIPKCGGWVEGPFSTKPELITRLNALNVSNKRRPEGYLKVAGQKVKSPNHYYVAIPKTGNRLKLFAYKPSAEGYIVEGPMSRDRALQRSGELEVRYNLRNPKFFEFKDEEKEPVAERKCTGCGKCLTGKGCSIARSTKFEKPKKERVPKGSSIRVKKEKAPKAPKVPKEKKPVKRSTLIYPTYLEMSRDESYPAEFRKQAKLFAYGKSKVRPVSPLVQESRDRKAAERKCVEEFDVEAKLITVMNAYAYKHTTDLPLAQRPGYLAYKRTLKSAEINGYTYFSMKSKNGKMIAYARLPKAKKASVKIEIIELDKDGRPVSVEGLIRLGLI